MNLSTDPQWEGPPVEMLLHRPSRGRPAMACRGGTAVSADRPPDEQRSSLLIELRPGRCTRAGFSVRIPPGMAGEVFVRAPSACRPIYLFKPLFI